MFVNEKILEEYSVKIFEIDPYFYDHYRKKIQVDTDRDLIFEEKSQKVLEKRLDCKFTRINMSKEGFYAHYDASRI